MTCVIFAGCPTLVEPFRHAIECPGIEAVRKSGRQVRVGALVAGVMDVAGASPRRFFFEVLRSFTRDRTQADRLAYFASPGGREDFSKYNEREGAS